MTPRAGLGDAVRPPKSWRPSPCLTWPYQADVARQLLGGPWHGPRPSHLWCLRTQRPVHNSLGEAAKVPPPVELLGGGSTDLEHCRSGGTLLSCR